MREMREAITRRDWLAASAAAVVAAGCARPVRLDPSQTTIVRAAAYDQRLYDIVRRLVAAQRLTVRGRSWSNSSPEPPSTRIRC